MAEWMRNEFHGWLRSEVMGSRLVKDGLLSGTYIDKLLTIHKSGRKDLGQLLWNLLNLSLWYKRWID